MKWFSIVISVFLIFNVTELYFSFIAGLFSLLPIIAAIAASIITIVSAVYGMEKYRKPARPVSCAGTG